MQEITEFTSLAHFWALWHDGGMKKKAIVLIFTTFSVILLSLCSVLAEGLDYAFYAAGRYHAENDLSPVDFEDGTWSMMAGIEIYDGPGYWQFAVDFADVGGTGTVGRVITPQINMNVSKNGAIGGLGILYAYVDDEILGKEWSDIYFQFNGGVDLALGDSISLLAVAHYIFENFDDISAFDFEKMDYTVGFNYKF